MPLIPGRDGAMRAELEAKLMFASPSELLVAQPISAPTQRLLGAYSSQSRGLRTESVLASAFPDPDAALASVSAFYAAGAHLPVFTKCTSPHNGCKFPWT